MSQYLSGVVGLASSEGLTDIVKVPAKTVVDLDFGGDAVAAVGNCSVVLAP